MQDNLRTLIRALRILERDISSDDGVANACIGEAANRLESYVFTTHVLPRTYGIDFDDTFTADPELWSTFVRMGKERGHKFYCVTARRESVENTDHINEQFDKWDCQMPIIFSNLGSKVETVDRLGIKIDIWCDDAPYVLVHGL